MPFVMAPNLWARLSRGSQKQMQAKEPAHKDGILVNYDSPEALDEVFWRVHCGSQYLHSTYLESMSADDQTLDRFRQYIGLILFHYGKRRYLSKNNNNILRLASIKAAFPDSIILVPFRDPVQHARSLLAQHNQFCEQQKGDVFVKKYMSWLSHHEFGLDHRPFRFSQSDSVNDKDPDTLDYWLQTWIHCYTNLLDQYDRSGMDIDFFCYEQLCRRPEHTARQLGKRVGIESLAQCPLVTGGEIKPTKNQDENHGVAIDNTKLENEAVSIYQNLCQITYSKSE